LDLNVCALVTPKGNASAASNRKSYGSKSYL
jgi:hypothetical protein